MSALDGSRPADLADLRASNLAVVLRFVRTHAPCSRAGIAAATGLHKATVSSLVAELIERRLLREDGVTGPRTGRPATMLVLDGAPYAAIGVEVNVDYLVAVVTDLAGRRLLSWRRAFAGLAAPPERAISAVAALARRTVARMSAQGRRVLGLTVGVPGLVDAGGTVRLAPNLAWRDFDLHGGLVRALGTPEFTVTVENDANLAALAEHRYGADAGTANLVYLTGEIGIGAGIVLDGRLLRGARGFPGEIGHVRVDPDGPVCGCGRRGCLEAVAGIAALIRRVSPGHATDPADLAPVIRDIVRRAEDGEPEVREALADLGRHLGHGASILANVLNPSVIVLGGYFVPLAPWLLPPASAELAARTLAPQAGGCRLTVSVLAPDAAAIGAAARVLDTVDTGDLPA